MSNSCPINNVRAAWEAATASPYSADNSRNNLSPDEMKVLKGLLTRAAPKGRAAHEFLNKVAQAADDVYNANGSESIYLPAKDLRNEARRLAAVALTSEPLEGAWKMAKRSPCSQAKGNLSTEELGVIKDMVTAMCPSLEDHALLTAIAEQANDVYNQNGSESVYIPARKLRDAALKQAAKALDTVC